jgi:hypothetical protein
MVLIILEPANLARVYNVNSCSILDSKGSHSTLFLGRLSNTQFN